MAASEGFIAITEELEKAQVPFVVDRGTKHHIIRWQTKQGTPRQYGCSVSSGSDWRGALNAKAEVRRMLIADGYIIDETQAEALEKKIAALEKQIEEISATCDAAMQLCAERVQQAEEKVLKLVGQLEAKLAAQATTPSIEELPAEPERRKRFRAHENPILEKMSYSEWSTMDKLRLETNWSYEKVASTLQLLKTHDLVENNSTFGWRRKATDVQVILARDENVKTMVFEGKVLRYRENTRNIEQLTPTQIRRQMRQMARRACRN